MKKTAKRVWSLILVVLLAMSMSTAAMAAGAIVPVKGTQTVYMNSKNTEYGQWVNIALASGSKSFTIKRSSVKVSKGTAGASLTRFSKSKQTWTNKQEYRSASGKWKKYTSKSVDCTYTAQLQVTKPGTATVKYKIGSKSYSTKVKVLAYKNPVKSLTITGVNGGANLASLTKDQIHANQDLTLAADVSSAKIKVTPAKGWKVTDVSIYGYTQGYSRYISCLTGLSSATLNCGKLSADKEYEVSLEFVNASNGAVMHVWYYVIGANVSYGSEEPISEA